MARARAPQINDEQLDAWRAFLGAQAEVLHTLSKELEEEQGLPLTFYDVLAQLSRAGGRLRMSKLADAVVLSRSGVTRLVDRMVRAGLVRREACPTDRRSSYAVLTPAGKKALKQASPVHARGIEEHFARHVSDDEAKTLAAVFGRMVASPDDDTC